MGKESLKCQCCGNSFEPTCHITRQKFCSEACRLKYNNAKRYYGGVIGNCPECGEVVEQTGERGRLRRFCSDRCRGAYQGKQQQERRRNRERPKQVCPNCGVEFEPEWGSGARRFCSEACRIEWWKEYHKANPKESSPQRICVRCGKAYTSGKWHGGEYCGRECYLQAMAETHCQKMCEWCGDGFDSLASSGRKYCSLECANAAKYTSKGYKKGRRHISYHEPLEWRDQIREASRKAGRPAKRGKRVWLVCGVTNMYLGLDGLLGIIRYTLKHDPFDGAIYAFCDQNCTMLKYLEWDGGGFCVSKRRAQSGSYPWPPSEAGLTLEISEPEFEFLLRRSIVPFRTKNRREIVD